MQIFSKPLALAHQLTHNERMKILTPALTKTYTHITKSKLRIVLYSLLVIGLIYGTYRIVKTDEPVAVPVLGNVVRGSISAEVSGTGQIYAQKTASLTSKVTGDMRKIHVVNGSRVTEGQILFELDATDAQDTVRNARLSLANAELDYTITERTQQSSLTTKERLLNQANAEYASQISITPLNRIDSSSTIMPPTITGTYEHTDAGVYTIQSYNCSGGSCFSYSGLENGIFAVQLGVPYPLGERGLYITFANTSQLNADWLITLASPSATNYYSARTSLEQSEIEIVDQQKAYTEALESKRLTIEDRKNTLNDALRTLSYYTIRAPFTGTIGNISAAEYNRINSGAVLGTLVAEDKYVKITLNEVDIIKVQPGQNAIITLDAFPNMRIRGVVASVDSVGIVTQGVVEYTVQVLLADNRPEDIAQIRAGMSAEVIIVTAEKNDVLLVPASAVKNVRGRTFVEAPLSPLQPNEIGSTTQNTRQIFVETGLTDDISTEIVSGIEEGTGIIIRTTTQTGASTVAPSIFSAAGVRAPTGGSSGTRGGQQPVR